MCFGDSHSQEQHSLSSKCLAWGWLVLDAGATDEPEILRPWEGLWTRVNMFLQPGRGNMIGSSDTSATHLLRLFPSSKEKKNSVLSPRKVFLMFPGADISMKAKSYLIIKQKNFLTSLLDAGNSDKPIKIYWCKIGKTGLLKSLMKIILVHLIILYF